MNYDLCDALNRKLVKYHQFYDGNWTGKSNLKNPAEFAGLAFNQSKAVKEMINSQIKGVISKVELTDLR